MAGETHQQGVAIGRRLGHRLGRQVAAHARLVLHHHRAAELLTEGLGQGPRHRICGPPRRRAHQDPNRRSTAAWSLGMGG